MSAVLERTGHLRPRILVVDDESLVRGVIVQWLHRWNYDAESCDNAERAVELVKAGQFDAAIVDVMMPGNDGLWLLNEICQTNNPPSVIMVSGTGDVQFAIHGLTHGATDFLLKPIDMPYLRSKLETVLEVRRMREEVRHQQDLLEEVAIKERRRNQEFFLSAIDTLIRALEAKDDYTEGHSSRVAVLTESIAQHAGLGLSAITQLVTAARCHDIGKIGVRDFILLKEGRLEPEEYDDIRRHPVEGARILTPIFKEMPEVILAVRHHHERYDGKGYPDGLVGDAIPLGARIIAIADAFDAMTSNRVYRRAMSSKRAVEEIIAQVSRQFCPRAVRAFLNYYSHAAKPPSSEGAWVDQRREQRYDCAGLVLVEGEGGEHPATLINISRSGIQFELSAALSPTQEVSLRLLGCPAIKSQVKWRMESRNEEEGAMGTRVGASVAADAHYANFVEQVAKPTIERRLYHRLVEQIPAELSFGQERRRESLLNLSAHGAFVQMRQPWALGAEIMLSFSLGSATPIPIRVIAVVSRRVEMRDALLDERAIPGIGVEFSYFLEGNPRQILDYIHSIIDVSRWPVEVDSDLVM